METQPKYKAFGDLHLITPLQVPKKQCQYTYQCCEHVYLTLHTCYVKPGSKLLIKITLSVEHCGHLHKNVYSSFIPFHIFRAYQQNQEGAMTCNFLAVSVLRVLGGITQKEKEKNKT